MNIQEVISKLEVDFNEPISLYDTIEKLELTLILLALEKTGWNKAAAGRLLKLNRTTLGEKLVRLGVTREHDDSIPPSKTLDTNMWKVGFDRRSKLFENEKLNESEL